MIFVSKKVTYYCSPVDDESISIKGNAKEFGLPSNLFDYRGNIKLRLTTSEEDDTIYDCKLINTYTNTIIEDVSEENIEKSFDIEYGKDINKMSYTEEIPLSSLEENEIYEFECDDSGNVPTIINDTERNCMVYSKIDNDSIYGRKIYTKKRIVSEMMHYDYSEGDYFRIMYKEITSDELLGILDNDDIAVIDDNIKSGEELAFSFEDYIYNDLDCQVKIITKDKSLGYFEYEFGADVEKEYELDPGEICEFDWAVDSVTVVY